LKILVGFLKFLVTLLNLTYFTHLFPSPSIDVTHFFVDTIMKQAMMTTPIPSKPNIIGKDPKFVATAYMLAFAEVIVGLFVNRLMAPGITPS
jgi:hypothetical protein